jgi:hypothetical protein
VTTLPEFLLARIAEDHARAEMDGANAYAGFMYGLAGWKPEAPAWAYTAVQLREVDHAARVLAECESKRRIVELHRNRSYPQPVNPSDGPAYTEEELCCDVCGWAEYACDTLRLLAHPYAEHPDFRPEWRA